MTPPCIRIAPNINYMWTISFPLNRDFKQPFHNHFSDNIPECMTDLLASASAGYVYVIFENEKSVRALLQACKPRRDFNSFGGEYYFKLSSRKMRSKEVGPKTCCWQKGRSILRHDDWFIYSKQFGKYPVQFFV